ncbi:late competence development ComFB family protein [Alicyclobacillus fastidiosus]|uniref:Late competence development ComFB family protein n=1 Tax=Alicyclobacillus fastidiosus TaxID=392011 RepID=A0ABV5ALH1_9BACL|nr:late competence development ComFB family protein [Alicyclobacillus fastidiosus]WEH10266.1 late competence development ComFB family protein [Alicyclobacillus fastidiosus]
MLIRNVMESITEYIFQNELLKEYELKCSCEKCIADILALTLNHLPPRYVATHEGELLISTMLVDTQLKIDVTEELMRSVLKVENNPQHAQG